MGKNSSKKGKGSNINNNNKRSNQKYQNQSEILEYNGMDHKPSSACDRFRPKMVNQPHGCKALREPRKPVTEQGDNFDYYHSGRNEPVPPCPTFSSACKIQSAVKPPPYVTPLIVEASGVPLLKPKDRLKPSSTVLFWSSIEKNTSNNEPAHVHIPFRGCVGIDQAIVHSLPKVATSEGTDPPTVTRIGNGNGNGIKKKDPPHKPTTARKTTSDSDPRSFNAVSKSPIPMSTPIAKSYPRVTSEPLTNEVGDFEIHERENLVFANSDAAVDVEAVEFKYPKIPTIAPTPSIDPRDELVSSEVSNLQNHQIGPNEKDEASESEIRGVPTANHEYVIDLDSKKNDKCCHSYLPSGIEDQYEEIDVSVSTWTLPTPSIKTSDPIPSIETVRVTTIGTSDPIPAMETVPILSIGTCRGRGRGRGTLSKFNLNLLPTQISSPIHSTEIQSGDSSNFADVANKEIQSFTGTEDNFKLFLESSPVTGKKMVRIFNVKSPQSFMIQSRDRKELQKLESCMFQYWDSDDYKADHQRSKAAELKLFRYYALVNKRGHQCFRVRLMQFREGDDGKLAVVTKIDYGEEETVSISNLMPLKDSWKDVPQMCCYAKCCKLTALAIASVDNTKFQNTFDHKVRSIELDSIENVSLDFEGQNYEEKFASVKLVTALLL